MGNVEKVYKLQQHKNGMWQLVEEFRSKFRIPENIDNYPEDALKEAERKFVKFSLLG